MDSSFKLKFKLFLAYSLTIISFIYSESCISYTCSSLQSNICLKLNTTDGLKISVRASNCKEISEFCPAFKLSSQQEVKCEAIPKLKIRQYPGGACKSSDDCLNNSECKEGKCFGASANEPCIRHDECILGLACYRNSTQSEKNVCQKLRPLDSEFCGSEFECQMNQGCYNGKCIDYFTLPDGTNLGSNSLENSNNLCASGHDRHGVCDSLKNINAYQTVSDDPVKCDELSPCRYASLNGTITLSGLCKCGKNADGDRFCPAYGGNKYFKAAVKQIKDLLKFSKANCNTIERNGICNFYKLNAANDASVLTYETLTTKLASFHEFNKADDCIRKIFYPQYNKDFDKDPVDPTGKKCPAFKCNSENNSEKKICARNGFDTTQNKTFVDLFKKSCDFNNEFCNFDRTYLESQSRDSLCIVKDSSRKGKRYAGEVCKSDDDCYLLNGIPYEGLGKCLSSAKKCSGFDLNTNCTHSSQCNLGLYCKMDAEKNTTTATCQKQETEGASCISIYDCKNGLICFNKKCSNSFYSVKVGENFGTANFTDAEKHLAPIYLCKYGLAKQNEDGTFVCLFKETIDSLDTKQGGLVPCIPEQKCNYTLTDRKSTREDFVQDCECGFNPKGQGYCKAGHNINPDEWDQLTVEKINKLDNNCHSLSRFDCDQVSNLDKIADLNKKTDEVHLFYNSESCALQVLSANTLKISTLIMSLILAFIF